MKLLMCVNCLVKYFNVEQVDQMWTKVCNGSMIIKNENMTRFPKDHTQYPLGCVAQFCVSSIFLFSFLRFIFSLMTITNDLLYNSTTMFPPN